jgi:hypothetical protein
MKAMVISSSMASSDEESEKRIAKTHSVIRLFQLVITFAMVFFPLVLIATLLCLFVTIPAWTIRNPPEETPDLPITPLDQSFFSTMILMNRVQMTGSFASNVAQLAAAPFLMLFSFLVALQLANRPEAMEKDTTNLLRGDQKFFLNWAIRRVWRARNTRTTRGTRIAGVGALTSVVLRQVLTLKIYT